MAKNIADSKAPDTATELLDGFTDNPEAVESLKQEDLGSPSDETATPTKTATPSNLELAAEPINVKIEDAVDDAGSEDMFGYVHSLPRESIERVREKRRALARNRRSKTATAILMTAVVLTAVWYVLMPALKPYLTNLKQAGEETQNSPSVAQVAPSHQEQSAKELAAREQATRQQASREQARGQAARELAAKEQAAREQAAKEQMIREAAWQQAAREQAAREQAAKERAAQEQAARKQAALEQAAKEQAAREQAAKEQAARERAAKEQAAREQAANEQAAREKAAKEKAAKEQAMKEQAAKEQAAKEQAAKEKAAQEQAARQQAAVKQAAQPAARESAIDLAGLSKKLTTHNTTRWVSQTSSYAFYVGNVLNAEYSQDKGTLVLTSEKPGENLHCSFSVSKPQPVSKSCSDLLAQLNRYLSR